MEKYQETYCKYCFKKSVLNFAEVLKCSSCKQCVHISCLKRQAVPGGIYGDTFFKFTCSECSKPGLEEFVREKMTWFQVVILIMYHIQNKNSGTANNGYFHWRIHLVTLIDKKWDLLFSKDVKRRKNWMGTVSGSLSHFSPCFFTSGTTFLGSNGWWKLTFPDLTPTASIIIYNELAINKKISLKSYTDIVHIKNLIRTYIPKLWMTYEYNKKEEESCSSTQSSTEHINFLEEIQIDTLDKNELVPDEKNTFLLDNYEINQILNYLVPINKDIKRKKKKDNFVLLHDKSIFNRTKSNFYTFWKKHKQIMKHENNSSVIPLREIEEETLYSHIKQHKMQCISRTEYALKRKLHLRFLKNSYSEQLLNIDAINKISADEIRIRHYTTPSSSNSYKIKEKVIACGIVRMNDFFNSPYTNRLLKPFIRRNLNPKSLWLDLMSEMMQKVNKVLSTSIQWNSSSLDYVYVRPNHIPVINSLCEKYFWPGVDLSEALNYPEFSCVVLYKKIVVGFGFMVPDVKFNESYISFIFTRPEWRRSGIGTFIIYHLIQTCMGKDITLHVAIDNPAMLLYQKFGFKVEQVIFNFYDTYLRDDTKQCKHAFFLRLER